MSRLEDWELRLFKYTSSVLNRPHKWGEHDCATFAADCVLAETGVDPMADLRGEYGGPLTARRLLNDEGVNTMSELIAKRLPEIEVPFARRGDVVICLDESGDEFAAVCQGVTAVGPGELGLIHVPMKNAIRAFRVGE
jgi:hypothetical protein